MSLVQKINGVEVTNRVKLTTGSQPGGVAGWPSAAWYGEPMTAGVEFDDPRGDLDISEWSTYTADETSCAKPRIFTGWLTNVRIKRGIYRHGAGRVWVCDILDQNAIFSLEVLRSSAASVRPAETDVARITALIASHAMAATPIHDNGRFSTANPKNFGASNYVAQFPAEVFMSVAGVSGKNFYAYWDNDEEEISLHYDATGNNPLSTIAISNVIADVNNVDIFFPTKDAELLRDPLKVSTGVLYGYLGGYVYAEDEDLIGPSDFSPVNFKRDDVYRTDRVGLRTTAEAQVLAQLADRAEPAKSIRVTVRLPASVVNLLHAGDAVEVRFSHLPEFDSPTGTTVAVIRRNVIPAPGRTDFYDVTLELSNDTDTSRGPGEGIDPGNVPYQVSCEVSDVEKVQEAYHYVTGVGSGPWTYTKTTAWASPVTPGNMLVCTWGSESPQADASSLTMPDGWVFHAQAVLATGNWISGWTKIAEAGESQDLQIILDGVGFGVSALRLQLQEWFGVDTVDDVAIEEDTTTSQGLILVTVDPTDGLDFALLVAGSCIDGNVSNNPTSPSGLPTVDDEVHPSTHETDNMLHWLIEDTTGTYQFGTNATTGRKGVMIGFVLTCSGTNVPPPAFGQEILQEYVADGDGTTVTFTTDFAYIPGSLRVYVDGVQIIAGLTETDPEAGEFTLDFAPHAASGDTTAERVTASYTVGGPAT